MSGNVTGTDVVFLSPRVMSAAVIITVMGFAACGDSEGPVTEPGPTVPTITRVTATTPGVGIEAAPLTFVAEGSSSAGTSYTWQFGDGSSLTGGASVTKAYAAAGTYTIQVSASNTAGQSSASTSIRIVSLRGVWRGTVTGHLPPSDRPIPITSFELTLNSSLPLGPGFINLDATWLDDAGCRQRGIVGNVSAPRNILVSVESLICNDGDFTLVGTPDDEGRVINGTCPRGGSNCRFAMVRQ